MCPPSTSKFKRRPATDFRPCDPPAIRRLSQSTPASSSVFSGIVVCGYRRHEPRCVRRPRCPVTDPAERRRSGSATGGQPAGSSSVLRSVYTGELARTLSGIFGNVRTSLSVHYLRPWLGYFALRNSVCIGTCGFKGPPENNRVEIAYFTFPEYEGRGYATQMAEREHQPSRGRRGLGMAAAQRRHADRLCIDEHRRGSEPKDYAQSWRRLVYRKTPFI